MVSDGSIYVNGNGMVNFVYWKKQLFFYDLKEVYYLEILIGNNYRKWNNLYINAINNY